MLFQSVFAYTLFVSLNLQIQTGSSLSFGKLSHYNDKSKQLTFQLKQMKDVSAPNRIILNNDKDLVYWSDLYVGTPPQHMIITFDFGYSKTWLLSSNFKGWLHTGDDSVKYNSSKSSSYQPNGKEVKFQYGGFENFTTILSADDFQISGLKLKNFTFCEVTNNDGIMFLDEYIRGMIGLGLSDGSEPRKTFVDLLYDQKLIDKKIVGVFLGREFLSSKIGGEITFGGVNENYFIGDIAYTPAINSGPAWQINMEMIEAVDESGKVVTFCKDNNGCKVTFDSSDVPFILGPRHDIVRLNNAIGGVPYFQGWSVPCNIGGLPEIVMKLAGQSFTLRPEDYVVNLEGTCFTVFLVKVGRKDIDTDWIFSYPIFGPFYTVFDYENKRVGFAEVNPNN